MKYIALLLMVFVCSFNLTAQSVMADEAVSCVQRHLEKAAYAVGKVDGSLRRNTESQAKSFAETYPELKLTPLSGKTASEWCKILSAEPGQAILATRSIDLTTPKGTLARKGGLNFASALVKENFTGYRGLKHDFEASLLPGRVVIDTDAARVHSGGGSIRMTLLPGDCGLTTHHDKWAWNDCEHGNERVETYADATPAGEWHYGLSLMLGKDIFELPGFTNPWIHSEVNLYQWFQYDSGACFNLMFNTRKKQLDIDIRCPNGTYDDKYLRVFLEDTKPDVWYEFVVSAKWSTGSDGYFRVLQNGRMVMDYTGPTIVPKGRKLVTDHPQIYAYGDDRHHVVWQYRTPVTVWFDDMIKSKKISQIKKVYAFDEDAFDNQAFVVPVVDLRPN